MTGDSAHSQSQIRERWTRLGVTVNELALPALCLNLPSIQTDLAQSPGEPYFVAAQAVTPTTDI